MESIFCEPPVPLVRKENKDYAHFRAFCTQQPHCMNYPWVSTRLRVRKWILVRQFIALCVAGLVAVKLHVTALVYWRSTSNTVAEFCSILKLSI